MYQSFGFTVGQFTKRLQRAPKNLGKKVNPSVGLRLGHFKLDGMEFLEGIDLQIYQYKEHLVLNQRQHIGLSVIGYTLMRFPFQGKMAVIFIPMVLESYQQGVKLDRSYSSRCKYLAMMVANLVVIHQLNFLDHKDKSKNALISYLI